MVQKSNDHHLVCPKPVANSRGKLPSICCRISTSNSISSLVRILGVILQPVYIGIRRSRCSSVKKFTQDFMECHRISQAGCGLLEHCGEHVWSFGVGNPRISLHFGKWGKIGDLLLNVQCKGITLPMKSATDLKETWSFLFFVNCDIIPFQVVTDYSGLPSLHLLHGFPSLCFSLGWWLVKWASLVKQLVLLWEPCNKNLVVWVYIRECTSHSP